MCLARTESLGRVCVPQVPEGLLRQGGVGRDDRDQKEIDDLLLELRFQQGAQVQSGERRVPLGDDAEKGIVDPDVGQRRHGLGLVGYGVLARQQLHELVDGELVIACRRHRLVGGCGTAHEGRDAPGQGPDQVPGEHASCSVPRAVSQRGQVFQLHRAPSGLAMPRAA